MLKVILFLFFCVFDAQIFAQTEMKRISVELNAAGELLIAKSNGEKSGFDAVSKKTINKIKGLTVSEAVDHYPTYTVPIGGADKNLTITVYGTKENATGDLGITGDGFVVRVAGIELGAGKIVTLDVQTDGGKIEYASNNPRQIPAFSFAFDPPDATQPSYIFKIKRTNLLLRKKITISFDLKNSTMNFSDNAAKGAYSLDITKINGDGGEMNFSKTEIISKTFNRFQLGYKNWHEQKGICLRIDDDAKGFAGKTCAPLK